MTDLSPKTQRARVTTTLYSVANPLVVGTEASYDIRDTSAKTFMLNMAKDGVVDMGLVLSHNLTRLLGTARAIAAADDTITSTAHGLSNGDTVTLANLSGGTGLANATTYYVVSVTTDTFKVATSAGGSAINVTTDGTADVTAGVSCLIQIFYGFDTNEIGGSASANGARIFGSEPGSTDMASGGRYYFLPEVSSGASTANPLYRQFEISELRAPVQSLKLQVTARATPTAGTLTKRVVRRY